MTTITLERTILDRLIEAWDSTVLPTHRDGMMQERMEDLRAEPAKPVEPATPAWHDAPEVAALKAERDELLLIIKKVSAWNRSYPSSRVYGYGGIKKIAAEMDALYVEACAAIAKAEGRK